MNKMKFKTKDEWNEYNLVEKPAIETLQKLGYTYIHGSELTPEKGERRSYREVLLIKRLEKALKKLNPWITENNSTKAVKEIETEMGTDPIQTNAKIYEKLVNYISLIQDLGKGRKGQTIKFIDFENLENNEFLITNQFEITGRRENIIPDILVFINGIPIAVIECKSPTIKEPDEEGLRQIMRYQNIREPDAHEGAEQLFNTIQITSVIWKEGGLSSTVGARERHYHEWKDPYPYTIPDIRKILGREPSKQDILLLGMFTREHLLDIIQNFIIFEPEQGKLVKKITRYIQYRAVNKAIERIFKEKGKDRGGVVWHTQGSGKSLEMVFLGIKLKRLKQLENPTIIIVTDRVELDRQIRGTFERVGFPNPSHAESIRELKQLIKRGQGQTIITTIQKFQELEEESYPKLTDEENIFLLVDEAHRTQYKALAMNMRTALPNACYIGFTGTPIDKKDKSTRKVFGDYIDTYTIEQSVNDGMTVPIFYEGRMPQVNIEGIPIDELFDRIFKDKSEKEREKIKQRFVNEEAIAEAEPRIREICFDIIKHYESFIQPNGFKAQIVTVSRQSAVTYKKILDQLNAPESAVVISVDHNDLPEMKQHRRTKSEEENLISRFLDKKDSLSFLIVCDKLLTGFDAPIEQVMYLDKSLKEHNLLQAIARVNRTERKKTYGLIIDYYGVSNFLNEALIIFNDKDVKGALTPLTDELTRLQSRHRAVMRFFNNVDMNDLEACVKILEPEDIRLEFDISFKKFSESMDMLMPSPLAKPYYPDLKKLGKIRNYARNRYRDEDLNLLGCGEKVKSLINDTIKTSGILVLHKPVSIISKNFDEVIKSLKTDDARASEMEHAIRYEIRVKYDENPIFYHSVKEKLDQIIKLKEHNRLELSKVIEQLGNTIEDIRNINETAKKLGFTPTEYAYHELIKDSFKIKEDQLDKLTKEVVSSLQELSTIVDWKIRDDIQRRMRKKIKEVLINYSYPTNKLDEITGDLIQLTKNRM